MGNEEKVVFDKKEVVWRRGATDGLSARFVKDGYPSARIPPHNVAV